MKQGFKLIFSSEQKVFNYLRNAGSDLVQKNFKVLLGLSNQEVIIEISRFPFDFSDITHAAAQGNMQNSTDTNKTSFMSVSKQNTHYFHLRFNPLFGSYLKI